MAAGPSNLGSLKTQLKVSSLKSAFLPIFLSSVNGTILCPDAHTKNFVFIIDAHPQVQFII